MHDDHVVALQVIEVQHESFHALGHDVTGEELGWENFVHGWQDDVVELAMVRDEESHQVVELVFVDVAAAPDEILGHDVPVGHRVEEVIQSLGGHDVALVQNVECVSASHEPSISEHLHHGVDLGQVFVVILVVDLDGSGIFQEIVVSHVIVDMTKQVQDELLVKSIALIDVLAVVEVESIPVASRGSSDEEENHEQSLHPSRTRCCLPMTGLVSEFSLHFVPLLYDFWRTRKFSFSSHEIIVKKLIRNRDEICSTSHMHLLINIFS